MCVISKLFQKLKLWNHAMRTPFLIASFIPTAVGIALAYHQFGEIHYTHAILTWLCVACLHIGSNLTNDYFDHKSGNDEANHYATPFNGGSRVIQDGLINAKYIHYTALFFLIAGTLTGFYLAWQSKSTEVLICGIAGLIIAYGYTAKPLQFGYHGIGEILAGTAFGPLVVIASYGIQTGVFHPSTIFYSLPIGMMVSMILLINEFPDHQADKSVNKNTIVVILGKRCSAVILCGLFIVLYSYIFIASMLRITDKGNLAMCLSLPLAVYIFIKTARTFNSPTENCTGRGIYDHHVHYKRDIINSRTSFFYRFLIKNLIFS